MNQTPTGPDAEVREALTAAVQSYGPAVLGNAQMLGNILTDLLPDYPRERSLLVAAAEAEAATLLQEQVGRQRLDAATAVALTARTLMERRSLDPTAARWVTTAYATALGYHPPPAPAAPAASDPTQPAGPPSYPPTQPMGPLPPPGVPDAPTLIGPPPSSSLPPTSGGPNPYMTAPQGFGPPGGGMPVPPGAFGPAPGGPPARRKPAALVVVAGAAAFALVGYLAIAGSAHLPPFQAGPTHAATSLSPSPKPPPKPHPSVTGPVLDPGLSPLLTILGTGLTDPVTQCSKSTDYSFAAVGLVAAYYCTDPRLPGGGIWAYQTDTQADYSQTWVNYTKWWGFDPPSAGAACPPAAGSQGQDGWQNDVAGYPARTGQVYRCETVGSGTSTQPSYTWALPTQNAFISAEGAVGSSFSALDFWWRHYAPPKLSSVTSGSPSPSPSTS